MMPVSGGRAGLRASVSGGTLPFGHLKPFSRRRKVSARNGGLIRPSFVHEIEKFI